MTKQDVLNRFDSNKLVIRRKSVGGFEYEEKLKYNPDTNRFFLQVEGREIIGGVGYPTKNWVCIPFASVVSRIKKSESELQTA